jgi:uncharacterized protein YacL
VAADSPQFISCQETQQPSSQKARNQGKRPCKTAKIIGSSLLKIAETIRSRLHKIAKTIRSWLHKSSTTIVFTLVIQLCLFLNVPLLVFFPSSVPIIMFFIFLFIYFVLLFYTVTLQQPAQIAAPKLSHSSQTSKPFQLPAQSPHQPPSPASSPTHLGSSNPSPHFQ